MSQGGREVDLTVLPLQDLLKIQSNFQEVSVAGLRDIFYPLLLTTHSSFSPILAFLRLYLFPVLFS